MSAPTCVGCGRPVADQAYECVECTRRLREELRDDRASVVALAPEVEAVVARLARYGGGGSGGSDRHPLPVNLAAAERAAEVANTVTTWARHIAESRGREIPAPRPGEAGLAVAAGFIADELEWLRHQPEAEEAFGDLHDAARRLRSLVGGPLPRWYAGPCWTEVDGSRCEDHLYAIPGTRAAVRCRGCGAEHDAAKRREWLLKEARDVLAHAALIAAALTALDMPVAVGTVYSWASRGRIVAHGHDSLGRPLYNVGEAMDLLAQTRRRVA